MPVLGRSYPVQRVWRPARPRIFVPLAIIGTPMAANAASGALPTHVAGDLIIFCAFLNTTAAITKPAAAGTVPLWTDIDAPAGNNSTNMRTAQVVANANNHTSGTWTGATSVAAIVIRNAPVSPIGGHTQAGGSGANVAIAPATTLVKTDGSSIILEFHGQGGSSDLSNWGAVPAGYTRQAATTQSFGSTSICLNTKTVTTTDGAVTQVSATGGFAHGYQGATIEILRAA